MRYLVIYNLKAIYSLPDARNVMDQDCRSRAGNKTLEIYRWMIYSVLGSAGHDHLEVLEKLELILLNPRRH